VTAKAEALGLTPEEVGRALWAAAISDAHGEGIGSGLSPCSDCHHMCAEKIERFLAWMRGFSRMHSRDRSIPGRAWLNQERVRWAGSSLHADYRVRPVAFRTATVTGVISRCGSPDPPSRGHAGVAIPRAAAPLSAPSSSSSSSSAVAGGSEGKGQQAEGDGEPTAEVAPVTAAAVAGSGEEGAVGLNPSKRRRKK
jgi:hypothetical protein